MADVTQNMILRISEKKTLQLIDLYRKEECLWNTQLDSYRVRDLRARAAERIARALNIKHFEAKHVMIKFKNLRNSYCQELKKIAGSMHAGLGDDVYRPRVLWFARMDAFLRPHLKPSRKPTSFHDDVYREGEDSGGSGEPLDEGGPGAGTEPEDGGARAEDCRPRATNCKRSAVDVKLIEQNKKLIDDNVPVEKWVQLSDPQDLLPPPEESSDEDSAPSEPRRKRRRHSDASSIEDLHTQILRTISVQLEQLTQQQQDSHELFGRYVASLLRALPPARSLAVQPRVVQLIATAGTAPEPDARVTQSDEND